MKFSRQIYTKIPRHYYIKNQWCEPNAEREFARTMLRRNPMTLEDYQGNVRAVIDGQGALEGGNNYYPYGAPHHLP